MPLTTPPLSSHLSFTPRKTWSIISYLSTLLPSRRTSTPYKECSPFSPSWPSIPHFIGLRMVQLNLLPFPILFTGWRHGCSIAGTYSWPPTVDPLPPQSALLHPLSLFLVRDPWFSFAFPLRFFFFRFPAQKKLYSSLQACWPIEYVTLPRIFL